MKMLVLIAAAVLACATANPVAAPTENDEKIVVDSDFFDSQFKIYSSQHDIINMMLPLNALNFDDDDDDETSDDDKFSLFYTEADIDANGKKDYKGLYVLRDGTPHKLLDNGRDSTAANGNDKNVYFAASDGIYHYDAATNKAEKYGTLQDSFINIVQENGTAETTLYAINEQFELFKITGGGTKKEKVQGVSNAQQVVLDFEDNIYFYDQNKEVYVINGEGVTKIQGLKANPKNIQLIKPAFVFEDYIPVLLDDDVYLVYANGTSELSDFVVKNKPTGYALEGALIQFYGYEKNIYKYNFLEIILKSMINDLASYFNDKVDSINEVATRSRSSLRSKPKA